MLYKVMKDCARKEGASKQDVGNVAGRNAPTNTIQKCLSACIGETVGLVRYFNISVFKKNLLGWDRSE